MFTRNAGRMRHRLLLPAAIGALLALAGCSTPAATTSTAAPDLITRLDALDTAAAALRTADDLEAAHEQAETLRNLIVGEGGPDYGDGNGDGVIAGATPRGVLPGLDDRAGLVDAGSPGNSCVARDLLGGPWTDSADRWAAAQEALDHWTHDDNTFPTLPSHAQRSYGWASLALRTSSLDDAHEYAGHLALHLDVVRQAVQNCRDS